MIIFSFFYKLKPERNDFMKIIEKLALQKDMFPNSERQICEHLLKDPHVIEQDTITRLAARSQVSTSAVLRFCRSMGYKGYKDFRYAFCQELHEEPFYTARPERSLVQALYARYIDVYGRMQQMDPKELEKLARSLLNGHPAFVTGIYYSSLPARMLTMGLQDRQIPVFGSFDYIQASHQNSLIKEDSTFIYFSIGAEGTMAQRYILDPIEEMPENSWLITLNPDTPLKKDFSHTLIVPGYELSRDSIVNIESVFMAFAEILLNIVYEQAAQAA